MTAGLAERSGARVSSPRFSAAAAGYDGEPRPSVTAGRTPAAFYHPERGPDGKRGQLPIEFGLDEVEACPDPLV